MKIEILCTTCEKKNHTITAKFVWDRQNGPLEVYKCAECGHEISFEFMGD